MTLLCPAHGTPLDGDKAPYQCRHGHQVQAADITDQPTDRIWL